MSFVTSATIASAIEDAYPAVKASQYVFRGILIDHGVLKYASKVSDSIRLRPFALRFLSYSKYYLGFTSSTTDFSRSSTKRLERVFHIPEASSKAAFQVEFIWHAHPNVISAIYLLVRSLPVRSGSFSPSIFRIVTPCPSIFSLLGRVRMLILSHQSAHISC
jgi:hypothetical protein